MLHPRLDLFKFIVMVRKMPKGNDSLIEKHIASLFGWFVVALGKLEKRCLFAVNDIYTLWRR